MWWTDSQSCFTSDWKTRRFSCLSVISGYWLEIFKCSFFWPQIQFWKRHLMTKWTPAGHWCNSGSEPEFTGIASSSHHQWPPVATSPRQFLLVPARPSVRLQALEQMSPEWQEAVCIERRAFAVLRQAPPPPANWKETDGLRSKRGAFSSSARL